MRPAANVTEYLEVMVDIANKFSECQCRYRDEYGINCHHVKSLLLVLGNARSGLDADWTKQEEDGQSSSSNTIIWKHSSGRATLYAGDMMQQRPELNAKFDAVYDKDAFGALPLELRQPYCQRLADYCKPEATVYSEVKLKAGGKEAGGPPFHVEKEDLMEPTSFGSNFHHVEALGEVYDVEIPGASQTAHIMKRK